MNRICITFITVVFILLRGHSQTVPSSIKTDYVQNTAALQNGGEMKLPPAQSCYFFYTSELNNNFLKFSECNALQDVVEIGLVSSTPIEGTLNSWSKSYLGYNKKYPKYDSNGLPIYNYHFTLIFRNGKYSIMLETSNTDPASGRVLTVLATYYSL